MYGASGGQSYKGIGFPPKSSVSLLTLLPSVGIYAYFLWPIPYADATFCFDYSAFISCKFMYCAPEECLETSAAFIYSSVQQFKLSLTFKSPVHREYMSIIIQLDVTIYSLFTSVNCSTCFGWYLHPSSGAHITVSTASGISKAVTANCL
jgi:hypothetical protein